MPPRNREHREAEIIGAAWAALDDLGPSGLTMQAIAKQAKASMETLYRWYGDRTGLFAALVSDNIAQIEQALIDAETPGTDPKQALIEFGTQLYLMVTSDRAMVLNRAAAADPSRALGAALAAGGRDRIMPRVATALARLETGVDADILAPVYRDLLLGDIQIRRATGAAPPPDHAAADFRARQAVDRVLWLFDLGRPAGLAAGQQTR